MPYKSIIFIKLFVEILEDPRWLYDCNERQQLLYIKMLLLAGRTENKVPKDLKFIKQKTNYGGKYPTLSSDIKHLLVTFPKFLESPNYYYFKNFKKYIPYMKGMPSDTLRSSTGVPKVVLDKIIREYIRLRGWNISTNSELMSDVYKRNTNSIKQLVKVAGDEKNALRALIWAVQDCKNKGLGWSIETAIKKYPEWLAKYGEKQPDRTSQEFKDLGKGIGRVIEAPKVL